MQIQLNQVEIETALRNYVNSIFQINDGMDISITLKATRGEDGQTAIIDIVPKAEPVVKAVDTAASAVAVQRRPRVTAVTKTETPEKETGHSGGVGEAQAEQTDSKEEAQTGNGETASSTSSDVAATDGNATDASQSGDEIPPATEKRSLFSGLTKPKNS